MASIRRVSGTISSAVGRAWADGLRTHSDTVVTTAAAIAASDRAKLGAVVIGRNEGERLRHCLESVRTGVSHVVYVDSGSDDGSVEMSSSLGIAVVRLDPDVPFTAARARNEGFRRLLEICPTAAYVLFVDGDCEVVEGWLEVACEFLDQHPDCAAACGRRRERYPEKSVYNMLCDLEWDTPIGETKACGGDVLMRARALQQVGGYRADLICGEEPELCVRLRAAGWRIWRLGVDMTLHDAAMYRFGQWWKRALRGGYGFAQGVSLHGAAPERHWVRESRRAWIWGAGIPVGTLVAMAAAGWWGLLVLSVYPLQVMRLALRGTRSARENWWSAGALVLGKFPEMLGQLRFTFNRLRHLQPRLIEYK
jgi:GT2 family glycosyltransferase